MLERASTGGQPHASPGALRVNVDSVPEAAGWDDFVATTEGGHHAQTSLWARVKSVLGWQATRVVVRQGEQIVAGVQVLTRSFAPGARVGFAPRGPLVASRDPRVFELLNAALLAFGREHHIRYLKVQPPAGRQDLASALKGLGWTPSAMEAAPTATILVDLRPDEDQILAAMRQTVRNGVRRASKRGLRIRVGEGGDFSAYARIVEATSRRQGFKPYPARYYETMWRVFGDSGRSCLLLAELDDRPLAASLLVGFGDTVTDKMGGWTGEARDVRPNEALHFAGMRWAKEAGYRFYDFDGIDKQVGLALARGREMPDAGRRGVAHFKLGFGGRVALMPTALDISPNPALRPAVALIAPRVDRLTSVAHRALGRRT